MSEWVSSAAKTNKKQQPPPRRERRREMARQRLRYGSDGDWEDRWRNQTDDDIATLQRDYVAAAQTMIEIREWIKNHDKHHEDGQQSRARLPDEIRGWIATAISIFTLLLMLYLNSRR